MKRLIAMFILCAMMLLLCACGNNEESKPSGCSHSYSQSMISNPGCTTTGSVLNSCRKCGDSYTSTVPAAGHNFVNGACTICGQGEETAD